MNWLRRFVLRVARYLNPRLDRVLKTAGGTVESLAEQNLMLRQYMRVQEEERRSEVQRLAQDYREAIFLAGGGWMPRGAVREAASAPLKTAIQIHESDSTAVVQCKERLIELELAMEDRSWKQMEAQARFEFSRWGIQQIILICRLYRIKNPIIQRGILISADYVFGRHVEMSSDDEDADAVIQAFLTDPRNQTEVGHSALVDREKSKYTDGNIFWTFFVDPLDGMTILRHLDPIEIEEIVTDPNDSSKPQYYHRRWTEQGFDLNTRTLKPMPRDMWYVALGYDPPPEDLAIMDQATSGQQGKIARDDTGMPIKVYHRKEGASHDWLFGCPRAYAALDWARARRELLEDYCSRVRALSRYGYDIETKGGPPAIAGMKQQMATTLANDLESIEQQPPPVAASAWVHGPGTTMKPFKTSGLSETPEESRAVAHMAYMVFGLPEHFFGDIDSGNLATATSLDRPTELKFLGDQEVWKEDLSVILRQVLINSMQHNSGKLREALARRKQDPRNMVIELQAVKPKPGSLMVPHLRVFEAKKPKTKDPNKINIAVKFPAIVEGDIPQRIAAIVNAMTMNGFETTGIDERVGVELMLNELLSFGFEFDIKEILDAMYPLTGPDKYDPLRTKEEEPPLPAVAPPGQTAQPTQNPAQQQGAPAQQPKAMRTARPKRTAAQEARLEQVLVKLETTLKAQEAAMVARGRR